MRSIAHHDHGQKPERMKFLRILFACPEGPKKMAHLVFLLCFCIAKRRTCRFAASHLVTPLPGFFRNYLPSRMRALFAFFDKLKGRTVFSVLPCFLSFQKTRQRRRVKLIDRFEASFIKYAQLLNSQGSSFAFCRVSTSSAIDEPPYCPSISGYPQCSSRA